MAVLVLLLGSRIIHMHCFLFLSHFPLSFTESQHSFFKYQKKPSCSFSITTD